MGISEHAAALSLAALVLAGAPARAQVTLQWRAEALSFQCLPVALGFDAAGAAYLAGTITANDYATVKFDPDGGLAWFSRFDAGPSSSDNASDLAVDAAGNVYVVGYSLVADPGEPITTVKYNANGDQLWAVRTGFTNGLAQWPQRVALAGSGAVVVGATVRNPASAIDFATVKYDPAGNPLWTALYDGPAHSEDHMTALAVDDAGNVYVTGQSRGAGTLLDFATVKYDPNGQLLWSVRYDDPSHRDDQALALLVDTQGNAHVAGRSWSGRPAPESFALSAVKYDANGHQLWAFRHEAVVAQQTEFAGAALDAAGHLHLAGTAYGEDSDVVVVTLDADGRQLWEARYSAPGTKYDQASAIAVDAAGNSYVTGFSDGEGSRQLVTMKFDPNGARVWVIERESDRAFDAPVAIRVDAAGNVFVAGQTGYFEGTGGFELFKYRQTDVPGLPSIVVAPTNQAVAPGTAAEFSVDATGAAPLRYQWFYQGRAIEGATNRVLTIAAAQFAQRGGYSVEVRNGLGTNASPQAQLWILMPPEITDQPPDQFGFVGAGVSFVAAAVGLEPLSYQWQRNGADLPDANQPTLTLTNLQLADAGGYRVRIANAAGAVTSRVALLTVSAQVRQHWVARYHGPVGTDTSPRIAVDGAGGVVLLGASEGFETGFDLVTASYDPFGAPLWVSRFNSASNRNDFPVGLALDGLDRVAVVGQTYDSEGHPRFSTLKYETNGAPLWERSLAQPPNFNDQPKAITADAAGNVYVTGSSGEDGVTIKYNSDGQEQWRALFDRGGFEHPQSIAVDGTGNVYVGLAEEAFLNGDLLVVKYAPDGHELWRTNYDSGGTDRLVGLQLDAAGYAYVAGQIPGDGEGLQGEDTSDLAVAKIAPDGRILWVARYRGVQHSRETPMGFAVDASGNSWVAFLFDIPGGGTAVQHFGVVKFSPAGQRLWLATLRTPEFSSVYDLKPDTAGNVYLTGLAYREATGADMATTKFDALGTRLWTVYYDASGGSEDYGTSIALAGAGRLLVAGVTSLGGYDPDIVLVSYEQMDVPGAPAITVPPQAIVTTPGATASFQVGASGAEPLRYQWFRKGARIAGATNAVLTLTAVSFEQEGLYAVEVANPFGVIRSADAVLVVRPPPVISQQPSTQVTVLGGDALLTVVATGGGEMSYQWRLNGQPLAGATNATLFLSNAQAAQSGEYTVEVTNGASSVLSQPARLTVALATAACTEQAFTATGPVRNAVIATDAAGNLYLGATDQGPSLNPDYLVLKYGPGGELLWQARYDFPGGEGDYLAAIAVDASGNVYLTGSSFEAGIPYNSDFATMKFDAQGHLLWVQRYESRTGNDFAAKLAVDAAGNVFVIGTSERFFNGISGTAWVTLKYAPDGTEQWVVEYRGPGMHYDVPRDLIVDGAGNLIVTGGSDGATWDGQMATIKYDTDGHQLWVARYEPISGGGSALALDPAGNLVVAGYSVASDGNDIVTVKYDSLGTQLWAARHHDPAQNGTSARAIAADASGNVIVTGDSGGDIATLKYDAEGHQLWVGRVDGPRHDGQDGPRDLVLDEAGNIYLAGIAAGAEPGSLDLVTIAYDPSGNRNWLAHRLGATSEPFRASIVRNGPGKVSVVGTFGNVLRTITYCPSNAPGGPRIVAPPQSQQAVLGTNVLLTLTASGDGLGYQWFFHNLPIAGATGPVLSLFDVTLANGGAYSVEVYNSVGSILTPEATLTINLPPTIVSPPGDACINAGDTARFQLVATGDAPLSYQWMFGGAELPGATNAVLTVTNVQPEQAGLYTARAENPFGRATATARLSLEPNVRQVWTSFFANVLPSGASLHDQPALSAIDPAGNLYVAGTSIEPGPANAPTDVFVVKFDPNGTLQWVAHHPAPNALTRGPTGLAVSSAGEVHLAMEDYTGPTAPSVLKFSASGELLWGLNFGLMAEATALALDPAGNAYVTTKTYGLVKVSPNGTRLWTATRQQASARAVTLDAAGNIYVAGAAFAPAIWPDVANDYLIVKYNASGQEQWSRTLRSPEGGDNQASAIAVDTAGNVIVTGQYVIPAGPGLRPRLSVGTIKYDPNGDPLWFATYGNTNTTDVPVGLKLDPANNVLIIASAENFEEAGPRWATLHYAADGTLQWARGVGGGLFTPQRPGALTTDASGNAYVTGTVITESLQTVITTVKYSPAGDELWTARFQDPAWTGVPSGASVVGVHIDPNGRVLVAGSIGWTEQDVIVLAYAQELSPGAPVILQQPRSLVVTAGTPATFSVVASNALHLQWLRNGMPIPGATEPVLLLPAALPEDLGQYSVRVESGPYCVESVGARLLVEAGPRPYLLPRLRQTDNGIEIQFVALPYASYILQASRDLAHWENIGTFYHDGGGTQVCLDPDPHPPSQRFYRLTPSEPEP